MVFISRSGKTKQLSKNISDFFPNGKFY